MSRDGRSATAELAAHPRPTSRSWRAPCATAGRWSTSTPGRPRRSRARCSTPSATSTSSTTRPCTAARTSSPRRPPTPSRPPGPTVAAVHRRRRRRGGVHQERHRGASTWSPTRFSNAAAGRRTSEPRAVRARARRRDRRHRDGAPRQPRAVAGARAAAPARRCAGSAVTDDGRLDLDRRSTRVRHRAHQGRSPSPTCPTCSARVNPVAALVAAGPRGRRPVGARRLPVGAAPAAST